MSLNMDCCHHLSALCSHTFLSSCTLSSASREGVEFPNNDFWSFISIAKKAIITVCMQLLSQSFFLPHDPWMTGAVSFVTSPWRPHIPDAHRASTESPLSTPLCWSCAEPVLVGRKSEQFNSFEIQYHMTAYFIFCVCWHICVCVWHLYVTWTFKCIQ